MSLGEPLSATLRPRFQIVQETADWIIVDKPAHLLAHPSKPTHVYTLWGLLRELLAFELACGGQISIITRLDRETSGLTLVAKSREAARRFCLLMDQHRIHKVYQAIAFGWPANDAWTVDAPILREGTQRESPIYLRQMVHPSGSPCRTHFQVLRRWESTTATGGRFSLIQATPETGRMHQIRVHLSASGHPIVGDKLYGPDPSCYLEFIETGWTDALESRLLLRRQALHAASLTIPDFEIRCEAPFPDDMAAFLAGRSMESPGFCSQAVESNYRAKQ